jgi:hypothetical protein
LALRKNSKLDGWDQLDGREPEMLTYL